MNSFEEKLKVILNNDINIPNEYNNMVKDALKYVSTVNVTKNNKIIFKKIVQRIAVFLIVCVLGVTTYAGLSDNQYFKNLGFGKLSKNYEKSKVILENKIENEYVKISVESIARDSAYIILEMKINLKEKGIQELNNKKYHEDYTVGLRGIVNLNNELEEFSIGGFEKISETEYICYHKISTIDKDLNNLELNIWYEFMSVDSPWDIGFQIDEIISVKSSFEKDIEKFEKKEIVLNDGSILILDAVSNTNFETMMRFKRIIPEITVADYRKNQLEEKFLLVPVDDNNDVVSYILRTMEYSEMGYYLTETGEKLSDSNKLLLIDQDSKIRVEEVLIIEFDDINVNKLNIIPYKDKISNDNSEYYNSKWYPVIQGDEIYSKENNLGGTLEITNISYNKDKIVFEYNIKGIVPNTNSYVVLRNKNIKLSEVHPSYSDKILSGKVEFSRDLENMSGGNLRDNMLNNINNLEFTLLYNTNHKQVGERIEVIIPEFTSQELKVKEFEILKSNMKSYIFTVNDNEYLYTVEYDNKDNLYRFLGDTQVFHYIDSEYYDTITLSSFNKASEVINEIEKTLKKYNIDYKVIDG